MLPKNQRLTRTEFSTLFESGKRIANNAFMLIYDDPGSAKSFPQISIVVSKKLLPKAFDRNAFRRRVYNTLKKVSYNHDSILMTKKPALTLTLKELQEQLEELLP